MPDAGQRAAAVVDREIGALGAAYAAKYPARLRSLILASAMGPAPGENLQLLDAIFPDRIEEWRRTRAALPARFPASVISLFHTFEFVDASAHARYAHEVREHVYNIALNNVLRVDMERLDFSDTLRRWPKPALVLHGRFDAVLAPAIGWKLHRLIPKSRMTFLERSGHMPFIEEPEAFAAAVLGFLGDVDAGRVA